MIKIRDTLIEKSTIILILFWLGTLILLIIHNLININIILLVSIIFTIILFITIIIFFIPPLYIYVDDLKYHRKRHKIIKEYKINGYVELKLLGDNTTYIYIKGKKFIQCMYLLLNIPVKDIEKYDEIENIDETTNYLNNYSSQPITPEVEFWGHCSNIQTFFENDLNTDILHSNIAFPFLKELVDAGYKPAEFKFREEIVRRFNSRTKSVSMFLYVEGYLEYLTIEDFDHLDQQILLKIEKEHKRKFKKVNEFIGIDSWSDWELTDDEFDDYTK